LDTWNREKEKHNNSSTLAIARRKRRREIAWCRIVHVKESTLGSLVVNLRRQTSQLPNRCKEEERERERERERESE
jgi:hypothetical protein